jgi:hypothetical protein
MGIEGIASVLPHVEGDFIDIGFDGKLYDFNVFDKNTPTSITEPFTGKNIIRLRNQKKIFLS